MSRRLHTQVVVVPGYVSAAGKRVPSSILSVANDGTLWETVYGSGKWTPCASLPQGNWGTGVEPEPAPKIGPDEWGSPAPPEKVEVA